MDEQTPKSSTKNEKEPTTSDANSPTEIDLSQDSDSPSKITPKDFPPFPMKTHLSKAPKSEEEIRSAPFQLYFTVRPHYEPFLPGISTVNHYFPAYEPLFKYLNFCTQSFGLPQNDLKDLKDPKGLKELSSENKDHIQPRMYPKSVYPSH